MPVINAVSVGSIFRLGGALDGVDPLPLRVCFDEFQLDEANARLLHRNQAISLAPKAFAVLCTLVRRPGALVTKDALLDAVWGHQFVSDSTLKSTISELRAALADDARQPRIIETASRRGYRFIATLSILQSPRQTVPSTEALGAETHQEQMSPGNLVGRSSALARLNDAWSDAIRGSRQLFWVAGEAGVGKTTLINHFVGRVDQGVSAFGQCVQQYGAGEPYLPVLEALAELCRQDPAVAKLMRTIAPTWLMQLPWLSSDSERDSLRRELAGANQDRMLREWGELIDRLSADRPLLLVTEDLHWSDHATVHLMNHMARRRGPARVMWIATFRLAEVIAAEHPLKALRNELRLHRLCNEVLLEPFSEQETAAFVVSRWPGKSVQESFVRALHARTDGLPLFVEHVLDDLVDHMGVDRTGDNAASEQRIASLAVPENLAGIIARQSDCLPDDHRALLEAASICGVEFRASTVADALGGDVHRTVAQCDVLARQQQWLESTSVESLPDGGLEARYAFRHALYRHVFYERAGAMTHARLHRRIAAALEGLRARGAAVTAAELATHFELGHDLISAIRYAAEAAESALRHFAPKEATDLSARALGLIGKAPTSAARDAMELTLAALSAAAAAQSLGVSSEAAKQGFERALALLERLPHHPQRALVLHGLGLVRMVRGEYLDASALAIRTYELARQFDDPSLLLSACSVLGQIKTLQGQHAEARQWLERGVAACEAIGDEKLQAAFFVDPGVTMYAALAIPLVSLGWVDRARASSERAIARARSLGEPMAQMVAAWFAANLYVRLDDTTAVESIGSSMQQVVEDAALAQGRLANRWIRGWARARQGDPRDGFLEIQAAYQDNIELGMLAGSSEAIGYAVEALLLAGQIVEAQAQLDKAFERVSALDERVYLPQLYVLQARIAAGLGRDDAVLSALREGREEARRAQATWLELWVNLASWDLLGGDVAQRTELADIIARLPEGGDTEMLRRARALLDSAP
ncbi:MAG: AAA family ATPase [Rhodocyclaceae bacterium]|nr:AAA family ATPase [Rhodocyclaceae bacterium]